MIELDTTNMCSHLQKKLFNEEGVYFPIWQAMQKDEEITAVIRTRQLHIYRNGKKYWYSPARLHQRLFAKIASTNSYQRTY